MTSSASTPVPHERIIQAVRHLIVTYTRLHPNNGRDIRFTVDIKQMDTQLRVIRGRTRLQSSNAYTIDLADIEEIVQMSLDSSYFVSMGEVFSQIRGSCIGSQISPALCNITVAFEETMWQQTFTTQLSSMGFFTRCVDNRLSIFNKNLPESSPLHFFMQLGFYGDPVTLEDVGDLHILGFNIDLPNKAVHPIIPTEEYKFRSTSSAGSQHMALTGAVSKCHTICRNTWPRKLIPAACTALSTQYIHYGADPAMMKQCQTAIMAKYRLRTLKALA